MWYLRVFEKEGDRLIRAYPLSSVGIDRIRSLWPEQSDGELVGLSWPVEPNQADAVEQLVGDRLLFDQFSYFIDFFAEEQTAIDGLRSPPRRTR